MQLAGDTEDVDISQDGRAGGEGEPLLLLLVLHAAICSITDQRRPRRPAQEALISGTQTATTDSSLRIFTIGFAHYTQRDRAHAAQRCDLFRDAMRELEVVPTRNPSRG